MKSPENEWGYSLPQKQRNFLAELIAAALKAVDPKQAIEKVAWRDGDAFTIAGQTYDLKCLDKIVVVGAGKAGAPMAAAVNTILGNRITTGWVNVKYGHLLDDSGTQDHIGPIRIHQAGHPLPDAAGEAGAEAILRQIHGLTERDLVICLLSGGGSALMPLPAQGVTLAEKQRVTDTLLACGATINEINAVRKHISRLKGGQLARAAYPAQVVSLILSDVVGNPLDVIASGPTAPDPSTWEDAWHVLERYNITDQIPDSVRERLTSGRAGHLPDTPKPGDPIFARVQNIIVSDNRSAARAALERGKELGANCLLLSTYVEGEAREVARTLAGLAKEIARYKEPLEPPACLILGGETTVTLRGRGKGGRNQELALAAALSLASWEGTLLASLATDGTDGPTDAAGALATWDTVERARALGLDPERYLQENDSYHFFEKLGDLFLFGPTNTNVNDLMFICVFQANGRESTQ